MSILSRLLRLFLFLSLDLLRFFNIHIFASYA